MKGTSLGENYAKMYRHYNETFLPQGGLISLSLLSLQLVKETAEGKPKNIGGLISFKVMLHSQF